MKPFTTKPLALSIFDCKFITFIIIIRKDMLQGRINIVQWNISLSFCIIFPI